MKLAEKILSMCEAFPKEGKVSWVDDYEFGIKMMISHKKGQNALLIPEKAYKSMGSPEEDDAVVLTWKENFGDTYLLRADKKK